MAGRDGRLENNIALDGIPLNQTEEFKHLRATFMADGKMEKEIINRVQKKGTFIKQKMIKFLIK